MSLGNSLSIIDTASRADVKQELILKSASFDRTTFSSMKELCDPRTVKSIFTAFEYARVYDDGSACILYSDPDIAYHVISNEFHISAHAPTQIIDKEFWYIPELNNIYRQVITGVHEISGVNSVINYIRRHVGYYEMYSFWRNEEQHIAVNEFINKKELLEQFCLYFDRQATNLIQTVNQDRFALTDNMKPNFKGLVSESAKVDNAISMQYYFSKLRAGLASINSYLDPKLSKQEIKCLGILIEGMTAKQIANRLHLSNRTVEMHLNSIKLKLSCQHKSDIVNRLMQLTRQYSQFELD